MDMFFPFEAIGTHFFLFFHDGNCPNVDIGIASLISESNNIYFSGNEDNSSASGQRMCGVHGKILFIIS